MIFLSLLKPFVLKYWKYVALGIMLLVVYLFIYNQGYDKAYKERTEFYTSQLLKDNKNLITKLDSIETLALTEDHENTKKHDALVADLNKINLAIKNKQLTTVKNGECIPSKEFLDSYNSIILRGNQK